MSRLSNKGDYLYGGSDWQFSLSKFTGKKVVDVVGHPSDPFGGVPVFEIDRIIFEDGTELFVEGEHDVAYLPQDREVPNLDEKTLQSFIEP